MAPMAGKEYTSGRTIGEDNAAQPLEIMLEKMREKNERLKASGHDELIEEEMIGARLYTGPMFEKCVDTPRPGCTRTHCRCAHCRCARALALCALIWMCR